MSGWPNAKGQKSVNDIAQTNEGAVVMIKPKRAKPKAKAEAGSEVSLKKQPRRGLTKVS